MARAQQPWVLEMASLRRNPQVLEQADEGLVDKKNDPVERAEAADEQRRLRKAIARLSPDQQQVIVLKFIQEMSNAEVARILDKPEGAVKSLQHRALTNLREWLGDNRSPRLEWNRWNETTRAT